MSTRAATRIGIVVLLVAAAALIAAVGRAADPRFDQIQASIGPGFVDAGANVLVNAQWHYVGTQTLTHSFAEFTLPAGWTLVDDDPDACTQAGVKVTCARGRIRPGDLIAQAVELRTDADLGSATVQSTLNFSEGPGNPGRLDVAPAPDVTTSVISADPAVTPNETGKCVDGGGSIGTVPGAGGSEASATVPMTGQLCTPFTISERPRQSPFESCLPGRECVSEIVTTDAAVVPITNPIQLKIVFRGTGLNSLPLIFTSESRQLEVPACTGPGATPDPCFTEDPKARMRSITWSVNWTGGDPDWDV